jgi:hypothetical protein
MFVLRPCSGSSSPLATLSCQPSRMFQLSGKSKATGANRQQLTHSFNHRSAACTRSEGTILVAVVFMASMIAATEGVRGRPMAVMTLHRNGT